MSNNDANSTLPPAEWDLLLSAAQKNLSSKIRQLVTHQGVDPSHANGVGQSALHIACLWGHLEAVQVLLELGANPAAANRLTGATPLIMTMQSRKTNIEQKLAVCQALIAAGANPSQPDAYGQVAADYAPAADVPANHVLCTQLLVSKAPPIFDAIEAADATAVEKLLQDDNDGNLVANASHRSVTALHVTVQAVARALVAQKDDNNDDKIQSLCQIMQLLLDAGATPTTATTKKTQLAPGMATPPNDDDFGPAEPSVVVLLMACRDFMVADDVGRIIPPCLTTVLRQLLAASPPLTTDQLAALWHQAARRGQLQVLQFLHLDLQNCWKSPLADVTTTTSSSTTTADDAATAESSFCSLVNATNRQGMTALHFGARSGQVAVVTWLLQQPEVNVAQPDARGKTARDAAVANDRDDIVQLLDAHTKNCSGAAKGD